MSLSCSHCGYANEDRAPACGLCGELTSASPRADRLPRADEPAPALAVRRRRVPVSWVHLGTGALLALVLTLTPVLRFLGWLLGSLFHETGHVAVAWFAGCPAWPAIRLDGHAAAFHQPQRAVVALGVGAILGLLAFLASKAGRWRVTALLALAAWPVVTFVTPVREAAFLLGGHLGEFAFAAVFLWRARTGEAVEEEAERPVYAALGWFLVGRNALLGVSLAVSPSARAAYGTNGSFGLLNDLLRLAEGFDVPLPAVAALLVLLSAAVFPLVLAATWSAPPRLPAPPRPVRGTLAVPTGTPWPVAAAIGPAGAVRAEIPREPPSPPSSSRLPGAQDDGASGGSPPRVLETAGSASVASHGG